MPAATHTTRALTVSMVGGCLCVSLEPRHKTVASDGEHLQTLRRDESPASQSAILAAVVVATERGGTAFGWTGQEYAEDALNACLGTRASEEDLMLALIAPDSARGAAFLARYRARIEALATGCAS